MAPGRLIEAFFFRKQGASKNAKLHSALRSVVSLELPLPVPPLPLLNSDDVVLLLRGSSTLGPIPRRKQGRGPTVLRSVHSDDNNGRSCHCTAYAAF